MATSNHTSHRTTLGYDDTACCPSADVVDQALAHKQLTETERAIVRQTHAMLHGDVEAAERRMPEVAELIADEALPMRTLKLARLVDVIAETA